MTATYTSLTIRLRVSQIFLPTIDITPTVQRNIHMYHYHYRHHAVA